MKEGIWYIAIAECSHKISYYKHQDIRIEIEFTIKNNGSHFSSENNK